VSQEQSKSIRQSILAMPSALLNAATMSLSMDVSRDSLLDATRVILHGCGSSYHACLIALPTLRQAFPFEILAIPSSELLFYPERYGCEGMLQVAVSCTGETPEVVQAAQTMKELFHSRTISISCTLCSTLEKRSDTCLTVDIAEHDQPAIQSFAALSMLLLRLSLQGDALFDASSIASVMEREANRILEWTEFAFHPRRFRHFVFLGSGSWYGLAKELAWKMVEMAQVSSFAFHSLEVRHGPRGILDKNTLVFLLTQPTSPSYPQEKNLYDEIAKLASTIAIDCRGLHTNPLSFHPTEGLSYWQSFFVQMLIGQCLAYLVAKDKALNADFPPGLQEFAEPEGL
jgi:glucosamine--fructose-6-phosphate aminotransferase (isomerizing)